MLTGDHIEKTFGESYRREIDQEENVWRSLPFFAATLSLQIAAVVSVADKLPPFEGALRWWLGVPLALAGLATLSALGFTAASVYPVRFRYLSDETTLLDYARRLDEGEAANPVAAAAPAGVESAGAAPVVAPPATVPPAVALPTDALSVLKGELVRQYAVATGHNRRINQRRAQLRSVAALSMLASVLLIMLLVGMTIVHHLGRNDGAAPARATGEARDGTAQHPATQRLEAIGSAARSPGDGGADSGIGPGSVPPGGAPLGSAPPGERGAAADAGGHQGLVLEQGNPGGPAGP